MSESAKILTLANVVTLLRLLLTVPVGYLVVIGDRGAANLPALLLFLAAAFSDGLDGYLARSRNETSRLGQILDPVADKALGITVLAVLVLLGTLPRWVLWTLVAKEGVLLLGGGAILGSGGNVIAARFLGKFATVVLFGGLATVLAGLEPLGIAVVSIGVGLSVLAGADYVIQFLKSRGAGKN